MIKHSSQVQTLDFKILLPFILSTDFSRFTVPVVDKDDWVVKLGEVAQHTLIYLLEFKLWKREIRRDNFS